MANPPPRLERMINELIPKHPQHGGRQALLMALILGMLRADRADHRRPTRVVSAINEALLRVGEQAGMPITCSLLYGVVDLPSGVLLYVNAGHPNPMIYNRVARSVEFLPPTTMVLGVQKGVLPESCHQFRQGDRLIMYTDGITDTHDKDARPFGEEGLMAVLDRGGGGTAEELAELMFRAADDFGAQKAPEDDQTVVVIDFDRIATEE